MGSGGSVSRSARSLRTEIDKLRKRELDLEEQIEKQRAADELKREAIESQLRSEKYELADQLKDATSSLEHQKEGWTKERNKILKLTFSNIPLNMVSGGRYVDNSLNIKYFPMVTLAQCDVVGFTSLSSRIEPQQLIEVIDHLQALIDEVFLNEDIFIMERSSDGCIAASGLNEAVGIDKQDRVGSPLSMTDSSYCSEEDMDIVAMNDNKSMTTGKKSPFELKDEKNSQLKKCSISTAANYSAILAACVLKLMSYSSRVKVPISNNQQLQLRVALHSGPCSGGVVGLQTGSGGSSHIPHYKMFGPTLRYLSNLCHSGLALQIRVSKQCRDLLLEEGGFVFERSPDYMTWNSQQPIESYWLIGKENLQLKLPSLDHACSLANYDDIITS